MIRRTLALLTPLVAMLTVAAASSAQSVDDLVAKNLQAKGGIEKLRSVQSIKMTSQLNLQGIQGEMSLVGKRPNLVRQDIRVGTQHMVSAHDGQTSWVIAAGATIPTVVTGSEADLVKEQANFDGPLVDYKSRGYTAELIGPETYAGKPVHHLRLTSTSGIVQDLYLDATTGLESRIVVRIGSTEIAQDLADYRDVQGFKVPYSIRVFANGTPTGEITVSSVELNPTIDDAVFRMK